MGINFQSWLEQTNKTTSGEIRKGTVYHVYGIHQADLKHGELLYHIIHP